MQHTSCGCRCKNQAGGAAEPTLGLCTSPCRAGEPAASWPLVVPCHTAFPIKARPLCLRFLQKNSPCWLLMMSNPSISVSFLRSTPISAVTARGGDLPINRGEELRIPQGRSPRCCCACWRQRSSCTHLGERSSLEHRLRVAGIGDLGTGTGPDPAAQWLRVWWVCSSSPPASETRDKCKAFLYLPASPE